MGSQEWLMLQAQSDNSQPFVSLCWYFLSSALHFYRPFPRFFFLFWLSVWCTASHRPSALNSFIQGWCHKLMSHCKCSEQSALVSFFPSLWNQTAVFHHMITKKVSYSFTSALVLSARAYSVCVFSFFQFRKESLMFKSQ